MNKFKKPKTIKERILNIKYTFLFWKGRSKGYIHTRDIKWDDIRYIFFPKGFEEKYGYLGTSVREKSNYFEYIYPLVLALDYKAKPKYCPRWFLRFLHVFGMDRSIVRVRNRKLSNLLRILTKGIQFTDWKTKWQHYDLRISIHAPDYLQDLANDIENGYYDRGKQKELASMIKSIDPEAIIVWGSVSRLEKQLDELIEKNKNENKIQK